VRQKRVLVFGESENDTKAVREFIESMCPRVKVETRRKPIVHIKNARPENVRPQADLIARVVALEQEMGPVVCVFAHKDCDCVEPGHVAVADAIENALQSAFGRAGVTKCSIHAVVPAWEMENWLLLWPDVLGGHVKSWRTPSEYANRNVGLVVDGKEAVEAAVRPRGARDRRARSREYRESDAPAIARQVRERGLTASPSGTSASYARFRASVAECCATA
jgi:hypothetical protein